MDQIKNIKLVSIIVITYNSSSYVIETLNSILNQDYKDIELIISDDSSADKTVDICKKWLSSNKDRFVRSLVITSQKNRGISANCNQGLAFANADWIKYIAGDDILHYQCITNFMEFVAKNPSAQIIESISQYFRNSFSEENFANVHFLGDNIFFSDYISAKQQYEMLLRKNFLDAPSVFIKKTAIIKAGKFDERFKFIEDYPLWLKISKAGNKIFYINKITVYYRLHENSLYSGVKPQKLFNKFYLKRHVVDKVFIHPNINFIEKFFRNWEYYRFKILDSLGLNNQHIISRAVNYISYKLSPFYCYNKKVLKRLERKYLKNAKT